MVGYTEVDCEEVIKLLRSHYQLGGYDPLSEVELLNWAIRLSKLPSYVRMSDAIIDLTIEGNLHDISSL